MYFFKKMKKQSLYLLIAVGILPTLICAKSIWVNGRSSSIYSDPKASGIGDIITVLVDESTSLTSSQKSSREKSSNIANEVAQFLFSPAASRFGTKKGELPKTEITAQSSSEGGGIITNRQTLRSRASVIVVDVLPNGNFIVEGVRAVSFSGQRYFGKLRGIVRPYDISRNNTIPSSYIADAQIEYVSQGSLANAEKEGWLSRTLSKLNPF